MVGVVALKINIVLIVYRGWAGRGEVGGFKICKDPTNKAGFRS